MKKVLTVILAMFVCAGLLFSLYGCFGPGKIKVGIINKQKVLANWAEYRDLMGEYQVERDLLLSRLPSVNKSLTEKQKSEIEKLNKKWAEKGRGLEEKFTKVVEDTAKKKNLDMVISNYSVEYGGIDITDEIKGKLK